MTYSEQMYSRHLNPVDNHCRQNYNGLISLQGFLNEARFHYCYLYLSFFSVLPSNFIVSGKKSSRKYLFLVLNEIPLSILFAYFRYCFMLLLIHLK